MAGKGRPTVDDKRDKQYRVRLNDEENQMLTYCSEMTGQPKSQIFRKALEEYYQTVQLNEMEMSMEGINMKIVNFKANGLDTIDIKGNIKYIQINNKTQIITPTDKGEKIFDIVNMSMPDMLNPKLTASWEKGLDMVAKKEIKSDEFMTKLEAYINSKINKLVVKI